MPQSLPALSSLFRRLLVAAACLPLVAALGAAPTEIEVGVLKSAAEARGPGAPVVCRDATATHKRALVVDLAQGGGAVFQTASPALQPGVYRAHVRMKLSEINSLNTAHLVWTFKVGDVTKRFDILFIETAGVYQNLTCPFTVTRAGPVSLSLAWQRGDGRSKGVTRMRVSKDARPTLKEPSLLGDDMPAEGEEFRRVSELDVKTIKYLYMALDRVYVTPVSTVAVTDLEVDNIRYKPGEKPGISFTLHNYDPAEQTLRVTTDLVNGLDTVLPVNERTVTLAGSSAKPITCTGPALERKWGYAARVRVHKGDAQIAEAREYFTMHDNMWAIVMAGRGPAQFTAHITPERARKSAFQNKRRYRNWVESGFWAPDEFGDFTPDTEHWWGGQGCYYGGIAGTRAQIEEGHKVGISCAVYSNLWGGDGPPAFEMVRQHPDWGYPGSYDVEWFERWDRNRMGTGSDKVPMHVWPVTIINMPKPEPYHRHATELIGTHKMFGWDAVRYDSYGSSKQTDIALRLTKKLVNAEVPDFQWGYNCLVPNEVTNTLYAFKELCRNGGLIMEEGIRGSYKSNRTYEQFARIILDYSRNARKYGGNFLAIGLDSFYENDLLYQYILWFAGNTHTCYDWQDLDVANYPQFATRFAGLLWDLRVHPLPEPERWVDVGEAEKFLFLWKDYIHLRELDGGRRQLIIHLINAPLEKRIYLNDDCKLPALQTNVALAVKLPAGAKVRNVWWLTPEYTLTQQKLKFERTGDRLTFAVPRLRFWSMAVVDLDDAADLK